MATRTQKIKVGIFLLLSAILMVVGFMIVAGYHYGARDFYWIEFEDSILGLSVGNTVEYLGVPVGAVENIRVTTRPAESLPETGGRRNIARVDISVDPTKVTLYRGVQGKLVMFSLATGVQYVSLSGGNPEDGPLPPGSQIPTEPSLFESVRIQMETVVQDFSGILEEVKTGLMGMEEGQLTRVVSEAEELLKEGRAFVADAGDTMAALRGDAESGITNFNEITANLRDLSKNTNDLVLDIREKIKPLDVGKTQSDMQEALQNIAELSEQLTRVAERINGMADDVAHEADNMEFSVRQAMDVFRETLDAVRTLAEYLRDNPSALVRGRGEARGD